MFLEWHNCKALCPFFFCASKSSKMDTDWHYSHTSPPTMHQPTTTTMKLFMAFILPWYKDITNFIFLVLYKEAQILLLQSLSSQFSVCLSVVWLFWIELDLEECQISYLIFSFNHHLLIASPVSSNRISSYTSDKESNHRRIGQC